MPGWYEATKALREAGKLKMVGITQEQHADRCRLFMQWKRMDFPVLVDSINRTGTKVVPTFTLLDEYGIVRDRRPNPRTISAAVEREWSKPDPLIVPNHLQAAHFRKGQTIDRGDIYFLGAGRKRDLDKAEEKYRAATQHDDHRNRLFQDRAWFRLGVVLCMKSEQAADGGPLFSRAMEAWRQARAMNPGQYIWRRRIQQYGPLLDKPYPFYDWVDTARAEIRARGEEPVPLRVEPRGSELAGKGAAASGEFPGHPDPEGKVERDAALVSVTPILVPGTGKGPAAYRVHLRFRPSEKGHWNNEAEPLRAWVRAPKGWSAATTFVETGSAKRATSEEERVLEFDVRAEDGAGTGTLVVHAFYNVCTKEEAACLYRRKDIEVELKPSQ